MIPDKLFKALLHNCEGYTMFATGGALAPGYKPDVLKNDNDFIILESELSTSRKTFIGGMIKAAYFLQGDKTGTLVYIMTLKKNTTAASIAAQLKTYLQWIVDKTNLRDVYVIEHSQYYASGQVQTLLGKDFKGFH